MFFFIKACFQSYGENCRYSCSEHCYNKNCDRFNGSCLVGCILTDFMASDAKKVTIHALIFGYYLRFTKTICDVLI